MRSLPCSATKMSFAGKIDDLGLQFLSDIYPWDSLIVKAGTNFTIEEEHKHRFTHVWVSPPHTETPLHFDVYHNMYVQLHGKKTFLLFPPSAWQPAYLYPLLHPGGRSSQIDLRHPPSDAAAFEYFFAEPLTGLQADLGSPPKK